MYILILCLLFSCCSADTCGDDGRVRVVGGPNEFEGRVEVCLEGVWARWCGFINNVQATVVCRLLGHDAGGGGILEDASSYYGRGTSSAFIRNVNCPPTASNITECDYDSSMEMDSCSDEGTVFCRDPACAQDFEENSGRLVSNISDSEELIEVCDSKGFRAGLCCEDFTAEIAAVLCRQQTQQRNLEVTFGGVQHLFTLRYLSCTGTEQDLRSCQPRDNPRRECQNVIFSCAGVTGVDNFTSSCPVVELTPATEASTTTEPSTTIEPNTTTASGPPTTSGGSGADAVTIALVVACILVVSLVTVIMVLLVVVFKRKGTTCIEDTKKMSDTSEQRSLQEVTRSPKRLHEQHGQDHSVGTGKIMTTKNEAYSMTTPVENSCTTQGELGSRRIVISEFTSPRLHSSDIDTERIKTTDNPAYSVTRKSSNEGDYEYI